MSSLVRVSWLALAALTVACSATRAEEAASSSEANLGEGDAIPAGPLTPDATFGAGGSLTLDGASSALALARRADGTIALLRNRAQGETKDVALTLVAADGSRSADVVLPGVDALTRAKVFAQGEGLVVVGAGARYYAARVGADGAVDPTFMPDPLDLVVGDAALDGAGRILVAGALAGERAVVVRLTANGGVDTTFAGGLGAWIDPTEAPSATRFLAVSGDGAISFASVVEGAPALQRLDPTGALDPTFGVGGRVTLPKHDASASAPAGLALGPGGALTYFGPTAESPAVHSFTIGQRGSVTPGAEVPGVVLDAKTQLSAVTTGDACVLHVAAATTPLTAAECAAGVPYVALGEGRRAIAVTTSREAGPYVSLRVFAP